MKEVIIYISAGLAISGLVYLFSRLQMKAWLDEFNHHFKNFNPKLYERKEE